MKRYGQLWEQLISWENLVLAAHKAQKGKRDRLSVQKFGFEMEQQLLRLQDELVRQTYQPGRFRTHWIDHPKSRMISVAPYRDRVVHHAVMNVLEPILDGRFHPDSYACRKEKGTLAAADRLQSLMRKYCYALQCDIQKFFPSLDHIVMKTIFRRLIKDRKVLWLMDLIVDSSNEQPSGIQWFFGDTLFTPQERRKGLPIGNLTSQWFANWYLNELDHFVTNRLGIGAYVRYCDDFILLSNDKGQLKDAQYAIESYLSSIRLKLHPNKVFIRPVKPGLTFVGYHLWQTYRFLKKANIRTFERRVRWMQTGYADGSLDWDDVKCRLVSWMGYAKHADTRYLTKRLSRMWRFQRGRVDHASCHSRRQLEQQCNELRCDQPQQQHADESQQQHWIPVRPALSENDFFLARNHRIYGFCECGFESPGSIPVLRGVLPVSRMIAMRANGSGRHVAERPICPIINKRKVA